MNRGIDLTKRLRSEQPSDPTPTRFMLQQRPPSRAEKGMNVEVAHQQEEQADFLHVKILQAADVDKDFRRVAIDDRYYYVKFWIRPNEELSTGVAHPVVWRRELDPDWEDEEAWHIPIGKGESVRDVSLYLELLRFSNMTKESDPGPSRPVRVVGRARKALDEVPRNRIWRFWLSLVKMDEEGGVRPEGRILVGLGLKMVDEVVEVVELDQ